MGVVFKGIVSKGVVGGTPISAAEFNFVGSSTFTVPAGVTSLTVKLWGAGGGSGGNGYIEGGGGGGGGAYASKVLAVTPGQSINYTVGTGGGAGGYGGAFLGQVVGTSGSATTCSGVSAGGGQGGGDGIGGAGGTASGGDINITGQSGLYGQNVGGSLGPFSNEGGFSGLNPTSTAPIFVAISMARNNLSSGFINLTQSASILPGDLLVTIGNGNAQGGAQFWNASTGASGTTWTEALDQNASPNLYVAYKTAVAADAGFVQSYNWSSTQSVAVHTIVFRQARWDARGTIVTGTGTGVLTVPSVTTRAPDATVLMTFGGTDHTTQTSEFPLFSVFNGAIATTGGSPIGQSTIFGRTQAQAGASGTTTVNANDGTGARAAVQMSIRTSSQANAGITPFNGLQPGGGQGGGGTDFTGQGGNGRVRFEW